MKLVIVSDTHGYHRNMTIPDGDVFVHAGDFTVSGSLEDADEFNDFLGALPHPHKVVIAGNHDFCFQREPESARALMKNAVYLQDEPAVIDGIRFYGSPWQPWFYDWAFNLKRGRQIAEKWAMIPGDTDVLVTHGPPRGLGDRTFGGRNEGCDDLLVRVRIVRPRLHVFGHIHEAAGQWEEDGTTFINASAWDNANAARVFELRPGGEGQSGNG
ncbi:MAG: metallophosphatase domain-containing protein [Pseudomonadota bacterium]